MKHQIAKIPTLQDLMVGTDKADKDNALMVILNQPPVDAWLKPHPTATTKNEKGETVPARYLPIERVEYLLSRIFTKWWVEIKDTSVLANSCCVTVRVYVINPITGATEWNDGVGASPIQTDKGKGAMDWNFAKSAGVMMALPSAETYAIKDAVEKWGKIFGKDVNRQGNIDYTSLLKTKVDLEDLRALFMEKEHLLTQEKKISSKRIIDEMEEKSYQKLFNELSKIAA